jgi:hypothetical protein
MMTATTETSTDIGTRRCMVASGECLGNATRTLRLVHSQEARPLAVERRLGRCPHPLAGPGRQFAVFSFDSS